MATDGIGARARQIRRRRGMSLDAAAGLAGISKGYLSRLERGERSFDRRSLIENLANAICCSPSDLTGMPDVLPDARASAAASAVPALSVALHDVTLDDVPDIPTRELRVLVDAAREANRAADDVRYILDGSALGELATELHVRAATGPTEQRESALAALVETCMVARSLAATLGLGDLAVSATRRGWDAARRLDRPDLVGLMAMGRAVSLNRIGARRRAVSILDDVLVELDACPGPTRADTTVAEATGMVHLFAAQLAGRDGRSGDIATHLGEARALAAFTGERNHMRYHFGPANIAAWSLAIAVETGHGAEEAARLESQPLDLVTLDSGDRRGAAHFDLARAYAQGEGGAGDTTALRHLDQADRLTPLRVRRDPLTRELVVALDRRAKRRDWELESMKRRVGIA